MKMQEIELRHQFKNALAAARLSLGIILRIDCSDAEREKLLEQALKAVEEAQKTLETIKKYVDN